MKYIKTIPFLLLLLTLGAGLSAQTKTQIKTQIKTQTKAQPKASKTNKIKELISSRNYVFQAQTVFPMSGRTRQISGDGYEVAVSKDTVNTYLPYFGRAYSAPIDPSKGGIQFISTSFEYTEAPGKKGGWDITIKPKDIKDVQQLFFSVSEDGYASLQVTSTNRQAISFNGVIVEKRTKKKK